ncbi:MAG: hypothetical protein H7Y27_16315 [Gemmatimonadaceae bacterium]|nr:hypothetical protein [Chitinophagaceae bacterium]
MKYFLFAVITILLGCENHTDFPEGGFPYPENIDKNDTNLYYYQIKNIEPARDAFHNSYAYLMYRPFNEANLSVKPQAKETFRFTYGGAFGDVIIITVTEDLISVKSGSPRILYNEDTSRLSVTENFHLRFLNKNFPVNANRRRSQKRNYLDSMTKLYPKLRDPAYYHYLYGRTINKTGEMFSYKISKQKITREQYISLRRTINSSGFWTLPPKIECDYPPTDGYGFVLEANTKTKYQVVQASACGDDTTAFTKACQRIVDFAKMDKEINLMWSGELETVEDQ